ncbi:hypothetical protein Nepgr_004418 [Nepenthes gracilis]|uniref:CRIB domain-containing protein n=1 Tax=Nepenthes gracilis TaxID=150966 RepID=A0AAD3XF32_NEPGR|nr:hypothetical protein Nepgr_004418 [Nepenthes gracilis]
MQIGHPTDVKHVAHIGWDGPTVNSPSWMKEFKSPADSAPSLPIGDAKANGEVRLISQGSPKPSRRHPSVESTGSADSPLGSPSQKSKHSRRRHSGSSSKEPKDASGSSKATRRKDVSSPRAAESSSKGLPNIPKQSRRKKSKDGEGSERSSGRRKDQALSMDSKHGPIHGSEDGSPQSYTSDQTCQSSGLATLHEGEVKG